MVRLTRSLAAALIVVFIASSCTPDELNEWQRQTGIDLAPETEQAILDHRAAVDAANALDAAHNYQDMVPVEQVYRIVAADRGWDQATIDRRWPFISGVIARESGGCYNLRRGASFENPDGSGCVLRVLRDRAGNVFGVDTGHGTDSGYMQVLMSVHASWLCPQLGLCTPEDVTSTPYNSMAAGLALIERSGKAGWCFTDKLRRGALCRSWPG